MRSNPRLPQKREFDSGAYKFSPDKLFTLVKYLAEEGALSDEEAQHLLGLQLLEGYKRYKGFLRSAGLLNQDTSHTIPTRELQHFWQALNEEDTPKFLNVLLNVPSFRELYEDVCYRRIVARKKGNFPIAEIAVSNYLNLGEAAGAWLVNPERGVVATDNSHLERVVFAELAMKTYEALRELNETEWILTGQWLEELALRHAVHPIFARSLLAEARQGNLLQVYVEGSTPDTRFDNHIMWMLSSQNGNSRLIKVYLYHGDFLIPGTASVRLSIQGEL